MKKSISILFTLFMVSFFAKGQDLNTAIEFYIAKNLVTKSAIVTSVFTVKMLDGKSLTNINGDVKSKLTESLKLSAAIKDGQEAQWTFTSYAVTPQGEFFADEKEAVAYLEKLKADLKKKGFAVTDYTFKFD